MIRKAFSQQPGRHEHIKWRSHEILRIEGFSDAVFAFAMTLLVISLEVPRTFSELAERMTGMIGFGICFIFLFQIWTTQYVFFRQYHLKDQVTINLNALLLFMVLFYVYPLKFLFAMLTTGDTFTEHGHIVHAFANFGEVRSLMIIYGVGFCMVYLVFALLYINAWKRRDDLRLRAIESFHTLTEVYKNLVLVAVGMVTIICVLLVPDRMSGMTGMLYMLIGPSLGIYFNVRRKQLKQRFTAEEIEEHYKWLAE